MPITHLLAQSIIMDLENDPAHNFIDEERIVLIDTDAGLDDAWAIFMALAAHQDATVPFRVVGITCTHGNTTVENVTVNVTRVLQTAGASNIPVFRGAESALVFPLELPADAEYGQDGFGDAGLPPLDPSIESDHAVNAIIQFAELYKGNLTIIALGPLTNLALALRLKPIIKHWIKDVYILGGSLTGLGNITINGEFNFLMDAEAAHVAIDALSNACPMYILPWDTALGATSSWKFRKEVLGTLRTDEVELMNKAEAKLLEATRGKGTWLTSDAVAMAVLLEPMLIQKSGTYFCTIEVSGSYARGLTVVDRGFVSQKPPNCTFIEEVDRTLYEKMLIWAAGGPHYNKKGSKRVPKRY